MGEHRGMAARAEIGPAGRGKDAGQKIAHGAADADALEIGQADGAVFAPARAARMREREDGGERRRPPFDPPDETFRTAVNVPAEVMVRAKEGPVVDRGASHIEA